MRKNIKYILIIFVEEFVHRLSKFFSVHRKRQPVSGIFKADMPVIIKVIDNNFGMIIFYELVRLAVEHEHGTFDIFRVL